MGKSILTSKQLDFLELAQAQPSITKRFYFTGGTALAEFYLHHGISEDIDLFSELEINPSVKDLKDEDFPSMLVPFNKTKMEKFFLSLAKSLEGEIFK